MFRDSGPLFGCRGPGIIEREGREEVGATASLVRFRLPFEYREGVDSLGIGECDVTDANDAEELAITPYVSFSVVELGSAGSGEATRDGVVSRKEDVGDILYLIRNDVLYDDGMLT